MTTTPDTTTEQKRTPILLNNQFLKVRLTPFAVVFVLEDHAHPPVRKGFSCAVPVWKFERARYPAMQLEVLLEYMQRQMEKVK